MLRRRSSKLAADPRSARDLDHRAAVLEAEGQIVEALDVVVEANRIEPDPARDVRLRDLRVRAAAAMEPSPPRSPWPPTYPDPFPHLSGTIPEVQAADLSADVLGGAVAHHGGLIVRGALASEQVTRLADAIETTHQSQVETGAGPGAREAVGDTAWYQPVRLDKKTEVLRRMVATRGGTWLADSPTSTEIVLAELASSGVTGAIAGHLGERPVFSLQKSTLRRSLPEFSLVAWHQDGSFLGSEVRTMNVWVALSACGGDRPSPGLEVLPRRLPSILPVDGVMSPHSVSYDLVADLAASCPTVIPEFEPGDAFLFDEVLLHRTHLTDRMTETRYALECWFFAPSHPAENYTALLV